MNLFKSFILVICIALLFIGSDLFLIQQEAAISGTLKSTRSQQPMASLMLKRVKNLVEGQKTIVVYADSTVKDVLKIMEEHHFQSVPVLSSKEEPVIVGIVDALDLVSFMLDKHTSHFEKGDIGPHTKDFWKDQTNLFHNLPVTQLIDYSRKQPVQTIPDTATLKDALDTFLLKSHRVAVVDDKNHFEGILSQSRVVEYLCSFDSSQQIPGLRSEICLKDFTTDHVVTVKESTLAWTALKVLRDNEVTSVAIEDDRGNFFDVISASDIKILNKNLLDVFLRSSKVFVELRKKSDRPPVAVYTDNLTPTMDVMRMMVREKVHRVFILKEHKVRGVISMTDVLRQVAKETA